MGITYTELLKQPAWFINQYSYYLQGKHKAQEANAKKSQSKRPSKPARRSTGRR